MKPNDYRRMVNKIAREAVETNVISLTDAQRYNSRIVVDVEKAKKRFEDEAALAKSKQEAEKALA